MKLTNAYICGCARNNAAFLDDIFKNISLLSTLFNYIFIIIFYDESTDNTLEILEKYNGLFQMKIIVNQNILGTCNHGLLQCIQQL